MSLSVETEADQFVSELLRASTALYLRLLTRRPIPNGAVSPEYHRNHTIQRAAAASIAHLNATALAAHTAARQDPAGPSTAPVGTTHRRNAAVQPEARETLANDPTQTQRTPISTTAADPWSIAEQEALLGEAEALVQHYVTSRFVQLSTKVTAANAPTDDIENSIPHNPSRATSRTSGRSNSRTATSRRCFCLQDLDIGGPAACSGLSNHIIDESSGTLIRVWQSRLQARLFHRTIKAVREAARAILLPAPFVTVHSVLFSVFGMPVSVTWLPPLSNATPVISTAASDDTVWSSLRSFVAAVELTWRTALLPEPFGSALVATDAKSARATATMAAVNAAAGTPLQLFLGLDNRFYCIQARCGNSTDDEGLRAEARLLRCVCPALADLSPRLLACEIVQNASLAKELLECSTSLADAHFLLSEMLHNCGLRLSTSLFPLREEVALCYTLSSELSRKDIDTIRLVIDQRMLVGAFMVIISEPQEAEAAARAVNDILYGEDNGTNAIPPNSSQTRDGSSRRDAVDMTRGGQEVLGLFGLLLRFVHEGESCRIIAEICRRKYNSPVSMWIADIPTNTTTQGPTSTGNKKPSSAYSMNSAALLDWQLRLLVVERAAMLCGYSFTLESLSPSPVPAYLADTGRRSMGTLVAASPELFSCVADSEPRGHHVPVWSSALGGASGGRPSICTPFSIALLSGRALSACRNSHQFADVLTKIKSSMDALSGAISNVTGLLLERLFLALDVYDKSLLDPANVLHRIALSHRKLSSLLSSFDADRNQKVVEADQIFLVTDLMPILSRKFVREQHHSLSLQRNVRGRQYGIEPEGASSNGTFNGFSQLEWWLWLGFYGQTLLSTFVDAGQAGGASALRFGGRDLSPLLWFKKLAIAGLDFFHEVAPNIKPVVPMRAFLHPFFVATAAPADLCSSPSLTSGAAGSSPFPSITNDKRGASSCSDNVNPLLPSPAMPGGLSLHSLYCFFGLAPLMLEQQQKDASAVLDPALGSLFQSVLQFVTPSTSVTTSTSLTGLTSGNDFDITQQEKSLTAQLAPATALDGSGRRASTGSASQRLRSEASSPLEADSDSLRSDRQRRASFATTSPLQESSPPVPLGDLLLDAIPVLLAVLWGKRLRQLCPDHLPPTLLGLSELARAHSPSDPWCQEKLQRALHSLDFRSVAATMIKPHFPDIAQDEAIVKLAGRLRWLMSRGEADEPAVVTPEQPPQRLTLNNAAAQVATVEEELARQRMMKQCDELADMIKEQFFLSKPRRTGASEQPRLLSTTTAPPAAEPGWTEITQLAEHPGGREVDLAPAAQDTLGESNPEDQSSSSQRITLRGSEVAHAEFLDDAVRHVAILSEISALDRIEFRTRATLAEEENVFFQCIFDEHAIDLDAQLERQRENRQRQLEMYETDLQRELRLLRPSAESMSEVNSRHAALLLTFEAANRSDISQTEDFEYNLLIDEFIINERCRMQEIEEEELAAAAREDQANAAKRLEMRSSVVGVLRYSAHSVNEDQGCMEDQRAEGMSVASVAHFGSVGSNSVSILDGWLGRGYMREDREGQWVPCIGGTDEQLERHLARIAAVAFFEGHERSGREILAVAESMYRKKHLELAYAEVQHRLIRWQNFIKHNARTPLPGFCGRRSVSRVGTSSPTSYGWQSSTATDNSPARSRLGGMTSIEALLACTPSTLAPDLWVALTEDEVGARLLIERAQHLAQSKLFFAFASSIAVKHDWSSGGFIKVPLTAPRQSRGGLSSASSARYGYATPDNLPSSLADLKQRMAAGSAIPSPPPFLEGSESRHQRALFTPQKAVFSSDLLRLYELESQSRGYVQSLFVTTRNELVNDFFDCLPPSALMLLSSVTPARAWSHLSHESPAVAAYRTTPTYRNDVSHQLPSPLPLKPSTAAVSRLQVVASPVSPMPAGSVANMSTTQRSESTFSGVFPQIHAGAVWSQSKTPARRK